MNSNNSEFIYLPVSLGEAIDKLTILDIKLENIKDNRYLDIKKEYDLLYIKLEQFIKKYNELYISMKKVNLYIWIMMDKLRNENLQDNIYLKICKETIEYNDVRFRIKNKINYISKSCLKEQKGYKINRCLIEITDIEQDLQEFLIPIKYYSFFYDEIYIVYNGISKLLEEYFNYDLTIKFYSTSSIISDENIKKSIQFTKNLYNKTDIYNKFELNEEQLNQIL